jgi:hypothetical protein
LHDERISDEEAQKLRLDDNTEAFSLAQALADRA